MLFVDFFLISLSALLPVEIGTVSLLSLVLVLNALGHPCLKISSLVKLLEQY
jgi:hypothetical protein